MLEPITISVAIKSNLHKVWDSYTQPRHVMHWNFANETWCCPDAKSDFKVGGMFIYRMASRDGNMSFNFEGKFTLIQPPHQLNTILGDGREVELVLIEKDNEIIVQQKFIPEDQNTAEMQRTGWLNILENFKKYVESN